MQAWRVEETSLKHIKNLSFQTLLTGRVYDPHGPVKCSCEL